MHRTVGGRLRVKKAHSLLLSSLSCNTLHWGFLFPFDRSSADILASVAALSPVADSLASVPPLAIPKCTRTQHMCLRFTRERKSPLNSRSGVLCCASWIFCLATYICRDNCCFILRWCLFEVLHFQRFRMVKKVRY